MSLKVKKGGAAVADEKLKTAAAGEVVKFTIHMPADLRSRLKIRAAQENRTMGSIIAELVRGYLDRE